ncbi:MFS transporter [Nocardiopsis sp. ATB16-24]|uniref:MFS transporter n=1 Tax=Nocardiopsis sp. ATB16-24 TaxID=3019555 RepID=UPI0025576673|nr:MFS transporter [Nocardiopsis sp. ATB16-24]
MVSFRPRKAGWPTAVVLGSAVFLALFDSTAVATALPAIGRELEITSANLAWVVNAYSLGLGCFVLVGGRIADLIGRRLTLAIGLGLLAAASVSAGTAPVFGVLLASRLVQGVAAALALPAALALTGQLFVEEPMRSRAFAINAVAGSAAGLLGAVAGGTITTLVGWRWIFLGVAAPAVLAVLAAVALIPRDGGGSRRTTLDLLGAALAAVGLAGVLYGLTAAGQEQPLRAWAPVVALGGAFLGLFLLRQVKTIDPLLNLSLLRSSRTLGGSLGIAAHSAAYTAVSVIGSMQMQLTAGATPAQAGLLLSPVLLIVIIASALIGPALRRFGTRLVAGAGLLFSGAALAVPASLCSSAPLWAYGLALATWAVFGGGINHVALTRETIGNAPPDQRGAISGVFETATHIGGALALAVYAGALATGGFSVAYLWAIGFSVTGAILVLLLIPRPSAHRHDTVSGDRFTS